MSFVEVYYVEKEANIESLFNGRYANRLDCRYDVNDIQSAGKVSVIRSTSPTSPFTSLIGTDNFEQLGRHVLLGAYDGQDVITISANSAGAKTLSRYMHDASVSCAI